MRQYEKRGCYYMQSKERITIQKIINYINDVTKYTECMTLQDFLQDKKTMDACAFVVKMDNKLNVIHFFALN